MAQGTWARVQTPRTHVQASQGHHAGGKCHHDRVPRVRGQGQVQLLLQVKDEGGDGGVPGGGPSGRAPPARHQLLQACGEPGDAS